MQKRSRDDKLAGGGSGRPPPPPHSRAPPPATGSSSGCPGPPRPHSRAPPPAIARPRFEPVDREKTCPLLLRVFAKLGCHHNNEDFSVRGKEPKDEVEICTWKDATLRELTDLLILWGQHIPAEMGDG